MAHERDHVDDRGDRVPRGGVRDRVLPAGIWEGTEYGRTIGDVGQGLTLLDQAHKLLVGCLEALPEEALDEPIPTQWHGESAAHFFWIMVMHRVSHAAQIRTIRRAYGSRTHYYPI